MEIPAFVGALLSGGAMLADADMTALLWTKVALALVAARPLGGDVLLGMATLLPHWTAVDAANFARRQQPVLDSFAALAGDDPALSEFTHRYRQWGREMARVTR